MDPRLPARVKAGALGALAALALLSQGGCMYEDKITGEGQGSAAHFRTLAVLPFSDSQNHGREISGKLARYVTSSGFNAVDPGQLDHVLRQLSVEPGDELSMSTLNDIRQKTLAEAVVMGSTDSRWREASLVVAETQTGDVVYKAQIHPRHGYFADADEIASLSSDALARWSGQAPPPPSKDAMPEPE